MDANFASRLRGASRPTCGAPFLDHSPAATMGHASGVAVQAVVCVSVCECCCHPCALPAPGGHIQRRCGKAYREPSCSRSQTAVDHPPFAGAAMVRRGAVLVLCATMDLMVICGTAPVDARRRVDSGGLGAAAVVAQP